jgi:hypothetical protein
MHVVGTKMATRNCRRSLRPFSSGVGVIYLFTVVPAVSLDLIFPGHDVLMSENYPKVAQDVTRLV